jgi:hypothetical protein
VLRLYGIPIPDDDARRLVATLTADGGDLALSAAALVTAMASGTRSFSAALRHGGRRTPNRHASMSFLEH